MNERYALDEGRLQFYREDESARSAPDSGPSNRDDGDWDPKHLYGQHQPTRSRGPLGRSPVSGYGAGGFYGGSRWSAGPPQDDWRGLGPDETRVGRGVPWYEPTGRGARRVQRGPKNQQRSDARVLEHVNDRLSEQDALDPSDIEVSIEAGVITLRGSVQSRREKFDAELIVADVSGVTEVLNHLRVRREQNAAG